MLDIHSRLTLRNPLLLVFVALCVSLPHGIRLGLCDLYNMAKVMACVFWDEETKGMVTFPSCLPLGPFGPGETYFSLRRTLEPPRGETHVADTWRFLPTTSGRGSLIQNKFSVDYRCSQHLDNNLASDRTNQLSYC